MSVLQFSRRAGRNPRTLKFSRRLSSHLPCKLERAAARYDYTMNATLFDQVRQLSVEDQIELV
jgi:hypothetical protein